MTDATWQSLTAPTQIECESDDVSFTNLEVRRVEGREAISELYRFDVTIASTVAADQVVPIDPDDFVGAVVTLRMRDTTGIVTRSIEGLIASARLRADVGQNLFAAYDLEIVPSAWRLTLVSTQEVFEDMSVQEIIAAKLDRHGIAHQFRLSAEYPKRDLTIQYGESDLAFVSRLAEHVGISFHFEQAEAGAVMVWSDHAGASAYGGDVAFAPRGEAASVFELSTTSRGVPTLYAVHDYNDRTPSVDLSASKTLEGGLGGGVVEFGSHYATPDEGARLAAIRVDEASARRREVEGKGVIGAFSAGARIALDGHPFYGRLELLISEVRHQFERNVGGGSAATVGYENHFVAVGSDRAFRPTRRTKRQRIFGLIGATVQPAAGGAAGDIANLDDQGRYEVQFHFDTEERVGTQGKSARIRMAQPFAGPAQGGMHFPLRPGTEVVIAFIDGDPDRPIIVGAVPNPSTPSPITSAEPHLHRIRSQEGTFFEFGRKL